MSFYQDGFEYDIRNTRMGSRDPDGREREVEAPVEHSTYDDVIFRDDDSQIVKEQAQDSGNSGRCWRIIIALGLVVVLGGGAGIVVMVMSGGGNSGASSSVGAVATNTTTEDTSTGMPSIVPTPAPSEEPRTSQPTPPPQLIQRTAAPTTEIFHYIRGIAPDGGLGLLFGQSYQTMALNWVEANHDVDLHDRARLAQRFALACVYYATYQVATPWTRFQYGDDATVFEWLFKFGWLEADDECTWHGITCNDDGFVEEIDLHDNLLTGSFPPEVVLLKESLLRLDLENNLIYNLGDAGTSWLGELTNLEVLNLGQTSFQYEGIPPAIGKLTNLVVLDLSYALLFGPLRGEIFEDLQKLQYLYIGGNSYNSSIPESVGTLSSLEFMYADFTDLKGDLSFLRNPAGSPLLFELWIDKNPQLSGKIPDELGFYNRLASLSLTDMSLTGEIPSTLGNLQNMQQLWLFGNRLVGNLPPSFSNMTKLNRLEVEKNDLTGSIPQEVCNSVYPQGLLEVLEADCDGEVSCPADCCVCCGEDCASNDPRPLQTGGTRQSQNRRPGGSRGGGRSLSHQQRADRYRRKLIGSDFDALHAQKHQRLRFVKLQAQRQ